MNLNQITVPSANLVKAIAFYKKLGLRLIVHSPPEYARFECPGGEATFSVHKTAQVPQGNGIQVYFECDDLDSYVEQLRKKGIVFEELPNDKRWLWREARLKDPDNNRLILFYAGENRKNPPWRLKEIQ